MRPNLLLMTALLAAGPLVAQAASDQPIATDSTSQQIDAFIRDAPPPKLERPDAAGVVSTTQERQVHGSAGVAVGSHGYRDAYVTSTFPVGKTGDLSVAVRRQKNAPYSYGGYGYGRPYGYGYGGPYGYGGTRESVGVSLRLGGDRARGERCLDGRDTSIAYGQRRCDERDPAHTQDVWTPPLGG